MGRGPLFAIGSKRSMTERGDLRNHAIIAIDMKNFEVVSDRTGRNQAIHPGTDGQATPSGRPIQIDRKGEDVRRKRRFDDREGEHRVASVSELPLVTKPLQDFLHHREAGDDLVELQFALEIEGIAGTDDRDSGRRVDEDHEALFFVVGRSPRIVARSPSHLPDPRGSRIRRALARRTKSASASMTVAG